MENNLTPMIAQYNMIKSQYKDYLLLYRLGDFYELFYEDALIGAKELNIVLTRKRISKDKDIPMCGIPYHSAESYITKLVSRGYSVAICEQLEDASSAKGIVKRDVIRVITPGTYFDNDKLKTGVMSIHIKGNLFHCGYINLSTGEFLCGSFNKEGLLNFMVKLQPKEVLVKKDFEPEFVKQSIKNIFITKLDETFFSEETIKTLLSHYKVTDPIAFGIYTRDIGCLTAAAAVFKYTKITQKNFLPFISPPKLYTDSEFMKLDQNGIKHLEILSSEGGHSLLSVIDKTLTGMGRRKLKFMVLHPLKNISQIKQRQEAVEELISNHTLRENLINILKEVFDVERLVAKISSNTLTPRDMVSLRESLKRINELRTYRYEVKSELLKEILEGIEDFSQIVRILESHLEDNPPIHFKEGGLIKPGVDPYLDELREIKQNGENWLKEYQEKERVRTGISSLKIGYNKVMGYYIEVTKPNLKYVPSDYKRRQTLSNAERFVTEELQQFEDKILSADEKIKNLEYHIFSEIRQKVVDISDRIERSARLVGMLDALLSLAVVALENRWTKPQLTDEYKIHIEEGKHPVVSKFQRDYVPNSVYLDTESFLHIITGPNMSGKSTFIRQVGLIVLLAQIGSFVPANFAEIGLVDAIFTRIGSADYLSKGLSTFMVEMLEVANILNNATQRSLIILDEVGRGTSTYDGIAIAWSLCEKIAKDIKAKTLFSTHYHELTQLEGQLTGVKNYTMAVAEEEKDAIRFLYKVVEGRADKSYGIHVAKLAGIPQDMIERAYEVLKHLETGKDSSMYILESMIEPSVLSNNISTYITGTQEIKTPKSSYAEENYDIIKRLEEIDIANTTPVQALVILNELKNSIKNKKNLDI